MPEPVARGIVLAAQRLAVERGRERLPDEFMIVGRLMDQGICSLP